MPRNGDTAPEVCPPEVWAQAELFEGWLTREEADLLYRYARSPWAEVGTYKGRSAAVLSARGPGHCVDLFADWYAPVGTGDIIQFRRTGDWARLVKGDLLEVADRVPDGLEFLYLDADHSYEGTRAAFGAYAPKVELGGYVAFHDALELHPGEMDWPGVNGFIHSLLADTQRWQLVAAAHRVAVLERVPSRFPDPQA